MQFAQELVLIYRMLEELKCDVVVGTRYNVINLERKIEKLMLPLSAIIVEYKMYIKWFSYDKNE